ncbi:hypothetical protein [Deinococcus depolymerans]|uniref:EF-hand domain-containing protein n=1 Tax=Deinococcus depolymerans TaxID=392408 RepID=A0ABN1CHJ9_9DEIO
MRIRPALLLLALLGVARAHPVDEVVQGAYLTLTPTAVELELDITPGSAVAASVTGSLDADHDGRVTAAEARAYATRVLAAQTLTLDGTRARWTLRDVQVPPLANLKVGGDTLKIFAVAPRTQRAGTHALTYTNAYRPAKTQRIANIFLKPGGTLTDRVTAQTRSADLTRLTVQFTTGRT